jgi:hypothetical protein
MKQILLLVSFLFIFSASFSQDIIYLLNGKKVTGTVMEVSNEKIRVHVMDDPDELIREIASREVYMITYRNGKEEIFGIQIPRRSEKYFSNGKNEYNSLSLGFGESHGYFGLRFQHRWGGIQGWGYHAGIGISPFGTSEHPATINFSAGVKYFFYKGWFIDLQFGTFPADKMITTKTDTNKYYNYHDSVRTAYGPSLMIGGDWFFNRYFGLTADMGFSVNVTRPDFNPVQFALDFGFIFRLPERKRHVEPSQSDK